MPVIAHLATIFIIGRVFPCVNTSGMLLSPCNFISNKACYQSLKPILSRGFIAARHTRILGGVIARLTDRMGGLKMIC